MPNLASSAPFTWDDFVALGEDDLRELIDGELVEVEVPTGKHEEIVALLCYFLTAWAEHGEGGQWRSQDAGLARGKPDLVVEVVSSSSRRYDRVTKLRWYAELGVPEYWIVDPEARSLERLVLREGAYVIAASHGEDEVFRPASFEGLEIPLARLWDEVP